MSRWQSALYEGAVMHRRLRPTPHQFRYGLLTVVFDLDELPGLDRELRLFSLNGFNLFSLRDRDHGDGSETPLRVQVAAQLAQAGLEADGRIRLMCVPRILGYAFNPLSIYFCERTDGSLAALLYEVHNTFGERHSYLIPVAENADDGTLRQSCAKRFYVSPFMDMEMRYDFRVKAPAETLSVVIHGRDEKGLVIAAALSGHRAALSDRALLRGFVAFPLVSLKIVLGIHWEALRLWLKGNKLRARIPSPFPATTIALPERR